MIPANVSPIDAGRLGLWLLSKRSHNAAQKRVAFPQRDWPSTLAKAWERLIAPWYVFQYPGAPKILAAILGVSLGTARQLLKPGVTLPAKHARRMADFLANHASQCDALAHELRVYADSRKFTNKPVARRRSV